ncbi:MULTISPECIES: hypothetical protein [Acidobacteriaceae]|uniref:hypothetical protein n=1 Tax=Acidobacteriaceae TaxID=204434 RepID=UPI00131C025F|nr:MULTISPECIES: hypothetical protein [Acidobacteriaceae]MDW5266805.1 hypothetical protein [Edaphobacter sp.]
MLTFTLLGSLPCLGMPFQQQSAEAVPLPAIAATLPPASALMPPQERHPSPRPAVKEASANSPVIVIGFLGGRVGKNNLIHREVQLAMHLRQNHPVGVDAEVFQNAHGQRAFRRILHLLDANHDGNLTLAEKQRARIIIYGHSWGASETVTMARQLQDNKIPVLLTILVDRVSKIGEGDPRIPTNVAEAVNFYQLDGLLHGRPTIRAVDPASTQILGNYQLDYKDTHVSCDKYPWYARLFMGPHIEIENDPRVWDQVEALISAKLPPEETTTATLLEQSQ